MDKQSKEQIKSIVGEGKLYEIELYARKVSLIKTKERDFYFDSSINRLYYFNEVSNTKSAIVKFIKDIFGGIDIKIIAYITHYCNFDAHKDDYIFKKITSKGNGYSSISCVPDTDCTYIVCTPNCKSKIKKFCFKDNSDFKDIEIV